MKAGDIIEVRNSRTEKWVERRFIGKVDNKFVCFFDSYSEEAFKIDIEFEVFGFTAGRAIKKK
jgi:hypothetical protein